MTGGDGPISDGEVKRFLLEAHIHLPFLLRLSAAPIDRVPSSRDAMVDEDGVEEMSVEARRRWSIGVSPAAART